MARPKLNKTAYRLVLVKATGQYAVSWTDPDTGKTRTKTTGCDDHRAAALKMPAIISGLNSPQGAAYTIGDLLNAYFKTLKDRGASTHSQKPLQHFFHSFAPEHLNDATWRSYRDWRTAQMVSNCAPVTDRPVQDSTAVRELRNVNAALAWGRRNGWPSLENKQVRIVDTPKNPRQDYLERLEVVALLKACQHPHQKLYLRIALATAARMSAILELKWENVTWPTEFHAVNVTDRPEIYDKESGLYTGGIDFDLEMANALRFDLGVGRGNKRRGMGLIGLQNMNLFDELQHAHKYRKSDFIIEYKGKGLKAIKLEGVYERAGMGDRRAKNHILKHTAITHLVMAGQSYANIAKLTGTSAEIIESTYGHHSPDHLARIGSVLSF